MIIATNSHDSGTPHLRVDVLAVSATVDNNHQQYVSTQDACRQQEDEESLHHVPQGDGVDVTCRQIAWVRATAVVQRWSGQPRRPLFHLQSSASDSATSPSDQLICLSLRNKHTTVSLTVSLREIKHHEHPITGHISTPHCN